LIKSLTKMSKSIKKKNNNVDRSLYHLDLVKIIAKYELQKQGIECDKFLMDNGFEDQNTT